MFCLEDRNANIYIENSIKKNENLLTINSQNYDCFCYLFNRMDSIFNLKKSIKRSSRIRFISLKNSLNSRLNRKASIFVYI